MSANTGNTLDNLKDDNILLTYHWSCLISSKINIICNVQWLMMGLFITADDVVSFIIYVWTPVGHTIHGCSGCLGVNSGRLLNRENILNIAND